MPTSQKLSLELKQLESRFSEVYDAKLFEQQALATTDLIKGYLEAAKNRERPVWPNGTAEELLEKWPAPDENPATFEDVVKGILDVSTWQHHPGFIGQQISVPPPMAGPVSMLSSIVNNSSAIFVGAPIAITLEHRVVSWMSEKVGYDQESAGVLVSGGTLGALSALLAMRQAKTHSDCWGEGVGSQKPLAVFVSEESHYCNKKACAIMGLGEQAVIPVPTDQRFRMDVSALKKLHGKVTAQNVQPIGVVANACSTATGSYDDLESISGFCQENDLWMHVDAAHGGSALLSSQYASLLKGIEKADSVVWDAHKMMLMPNVCTAVLFKKEKHLDETFRQNAAYLLSENDASWQQPAARSLETTKPTMVLPLYVALRTLGPQFFSDVIDHAYGLARAFADELAARDDFEYLLQPQSNIVCFRRIQTGDSAETQVALRERINASGRFFIMKTTLRGDVWLRIVLMNPMTTLEHLNELLDELSAMNV